ncbi:MAG TPA: hypothetical protein VF064_14225 [Pyrinomonadaceae bacterium]
MLGNTLTLAPVRALAEGAHRALDNDVEAARLLACDEQQLPLPEAALDRAFGERA